MPLIQVIVYAVIQGLTEFLPVSSTAHLVLLPWLMHWEDPGLTFDVALHLGTLLALVAYYWKDWIDLLGGAAGMQPGLSRQHYSQQRWLLGWMVVATIPAGVAGYLFEHRVETQARQPMVIAASLIGVAGLMIWAERRAHQDKRISQISFLDTLWIGVLQALALIPGVSRSGITITAGLFRGLNREASARFSFLLATPIIAGAALKKALEIHHTGLSPEMRAPFICGIILSAVVGWITLRILTVFYEKHSLEGFAFYRVALGIFILAIGFLR
ncbi:MAG: undecaprenyl-diphosphatase UppP [Acidobacteriia bacterium]|nr:undecaprenyl-diphosphatase UppP [Terriglobia bacterium]